MEIKRVEPSFGLFTMIPIMGLFIFLMCILDRPPPSALVHYRIDDGTRVSMYTPDCIEFGRGGVDTLQYRENDVDKSVQAFNPNRAESSGFKACMGILTDLAKAKQREGVPVNPYDERFKKGIYTKVGFGHNEQGPYFTTFYLNGKKINAITMAIEACVNPSYNGQVTFSYQGETFRSGSINDIEQNFRMGYLLNEACSNLAKNRK